jgi:tRNA-modifying protein YgfZ
MSLLEKHISLGATVAPDGIPLQYGDLKAEYHAALNQAVLMDRSHEGRIEARGRDRFELIQRISTNDVVNMVLGEGRATIFTNANGRILDRIMIYHRGDTALITTEPGRGAPLTTFLQRQVFFNDEAAFTDISPVTRQFVLHGPNADMVVNAIVTNATSTDSLYGIEGKIADIPVFVARRKPLSGGHWAFYVASEHSESVWQAILDIGPAHGLIPAGSQTYNALRIYAGRPGGRELSVDFIPLEAGLWDEVSFTKGCYTGQEIIARMESRNRLAKTIVKLRLSAWVEAPANLYFDGKSVGTLTSSVVTPDQEILAVGFVKVAMANVDEKFRVGEADVEAVITALAGAQPPQLVEG